MNSKPSILYVEDNIDILEEIIFFLGHYFTEVYTAKDGKEGLDKFKEHKPDIVVTDIQMPIMNGIELISEINKIEPDTPVIVTTAFNDSVYLMQAIELQVKSYLMKPLDLKKFRHAIDEIYEPIKLKKELIQKNKDYEELNKNLELMVEQKVDELKSNIKLLDSYKEAIDKGSIVAIADENQKLVYVNDNYCEISGYSKDELIGFYFDKVKHPDVDIAFVDAMTHSLQTKGMWQGVIKHKRKDESSYWLSVSITMLCDEDKTNIKYIVIATDLTKEMEHNEQLYRLANIDKLTSLFNRNKFLEDLETKDNTFLSILNIKRFRDINDFYGFEFGDLVIKRFAEYLQDSIENKDITPYRLHSDEFALLSDKDIKTDTIILLDSMIEELSNKSFVIEEKSIYLDVSATISFEKDNLLKTADITKKSAKKDFGNIFIYSKDLNLEKESEEYMFWLKKIKYAHFNKGFIPYFQPIVDNVTHDIVKYEVLVRMLDESGVVYMPHDFLDIAKKTKYYMDITKSIIKSSFEYFKDREYAFAINLTVKDIVDYETQYFILNELSRFEGSNRVIFEIEESQGIERYDDIIKFINAIKEYNCKIAIDDFGTGYSNFEYLLKLKADFIKIDGSLIKDLADNETSKIVVKNIVRFAKDLGIKTVAEYVKDEAVFNVVKELGIDYSQGFNFSKPIPSLDG